MRHRTTGAARAGRRTRALAALAGFLALAGAGAAWAGCQLQGVAQLPVTMIDQAPTIEARINGKPVRLTADTGAFYSFMSPETVKELGLRPDPTTVGYDASGVGGAFKTAIVDVKDFELAGIHLHDHGFLVGGGALGAGLAGLVGRDILSFADAEFDLSAGVIRIFHPLDCDKSVLAYWVKPGGAFGSVDLKTKSKVEGMFAPPILFDAYVNGKSVTAMLDSGANHSFLTLEGARYVGLNMNGPAVASDGLVGGLGRRPVRQWVARLASVEIGGETVRNAPLEVIDTQIFGVGVDMVIGADFLLSHRVYVANGQHRLYFTYDGGPVFLADAKLTPVAHQSAPASDDAAELARRAAAEYARNEFSAAIADYGRAIVVDPKSAEDYFGRALARRDLGDAKGAGADLDQAIALEPKFGAALLARANLRTKAHDLAGATADLDAASGVLPQEADDRLDVAKGYFNAGDLKRAAAQFAIWLAAHPDDSEAHVALAGRCKALAIEGVQIDQASSDCERALRLAKSDTSPLVGRGFFRLRRGDAAGAEADFTARLAADQTSAWGFWGRGLARIRLGQTAAGRADLAAAAKLDPDLPKIAARNGLAAPGAS